MQKTQPMMHLTKLWDAIKRDAMPVKISILGTNLGVKSKMVRPMNIPEWDEEPELETVESTETVMWADTAYNYLHQGKAKVRMAGHTSPGVLIESGTNRVAITFEIKPQTAESLYEGIFPLRSEWLDAIRNHK